MHVKTQTQLSNLFIVQWGFLSSFTHTTEKATVGGEPQRPQGFRQTSGEIINEKLFIWNREREGGKNF